MTQKNHDDLVKELRELVIVQEKRVTFNFLSRKYGISVFRSQELIQKLKEQLKEDGRDNEIVVSYVIAGYMGDTSNTTGGDVRDDCCVKTIKIMHVDESELEECKKSFSKVTGVTIKSIRGSNVLTSDRSLEDTLTIESRDSHSEPFNYKQTSPKVSKADISQSPKEEKKVDILDDSLKSHDNSSQETSHSSKASPCKEEPECSMANGTLSNKHSTKTLISNGNGASVSSDDDEEPITKKRQPKVEKSDSDDEEIVVPKKRRRVKAYNIDSEEEDDEVEKDQENEETSEISNSNHKQKSRATVKEEKERERKRKMNGKVKVKEDDPGEPHELVEEDEVDVDEDGYAVTRKVKRAVKKEVAEVKVENSAKSDVAKKKSTSSSSKVQETEANSSQTKAQKPILSTSQKKITDFFSKPKK